MSALQPRKLALGDIAAILQEGRRLTLLECLQLSELCEPPAYRAARRIRERDRAVAAAFHLMALDAPGASANARGVKLASLLNRYLAGLIWRQERHQEHLHDVDGLRRMIHRIALLNDGRSLTASTLRRVGKTTLAPPQGQDLA